MEIVESELMSLPDHLRRTYMFVASKEECDAIVASNLTGRCRALESNYLNQLVRMGWLNKREVSKTTICYLAQERPLNRLTAREVAFAKLEGSRLEGDFKKYFAEPISMGNLKKVG